MKCERCGKELSDSDLYCSRCGKAVFPEYMDEEDIWAYYKSDEELEQILKAEEGYEYAIRTETEDGPVWQWAQEEQYLKVASRQDFLYEALFAFTSLMSVVTVSLGYKKAYLLGILQGILCTFCASLLKEAVVEEKKKVKLRK